MKVPKSRQSTDGHYAPYPSTASSSTSTSPHFNRPALPTPKRERNPSLTLTIGDSPSTTNSGNYKVARAISSCTRCRTRKQKCDGKLPACSACEKANVECIGFDAISKTNVSRNYLHSLEQEITSLRAQVAALTSTDPIGSTKRDIAAAASNAVSSFSRSDIPRSDFPIDPALQGEDGSARSPWDTSAPYGHTITPAPLPSPSYTHQRRHSDYPFPSHTGDSPRSPYFGSRTHPTGQNAGINSSSLTRMVHDAALRTGHAANPGSSLNPPGSTHSGSDKSSSVHGYDSPRVQTHDGIDSTLNSPEAILTPRSAAAGVPISNRRGTLSSPRISNSAPLSSASMTKSKRRPFAVPPLPPQPAVERLVAAYVDFVGVAAPIIHIPSLGKQLLKIREGINVEETDIFVVMMVLALSTMASSRFVEPPDELRACSEAFHAEAMKHLDAVFEEQSYVGLQAILLLVWYALLNPDKGSIWFLVGLATRTCVDLGFHNEHNAQVEQLDALELDMRRRLFWCTYKMDRLLSQSLGRPPSIPDGFIDVPHPSHLHDVDIHPDHYGPLTGEPCSYKAVFLHTIRFRQLQSEILFMTYGVHGNTGRLPSSEWFDDCYSRLKTWLATAPEPRGTVSTEGYAISFHNCSLLLFRPSPGCPRPGRQALSTVLSSSSYIIRIYRRMQLNDRISWLWMTSHFSFMAGLSLLYSFFNLYSTGGGPNMPTIDDAIMDIDSCLAVLEYLSPRVPSAAACHDTLQKLSQAIFDQLSRLEPPSTSSTSNRASASSPGLHFRGAPISSSREDPLPVTLSNETFPTPLPPVALPYELSLLDNLFRNPMASHNKASEYTSNKNCRGKKGADENGQIHQQQHDAGGPPPVGFPPGAFHTNPSTINGSASGNGNGNGNIQGQGGGNLPETLAQATASNSTYGDPHKLMGPYGMAAQVGLGTNGASPNFTSSTNTPLPPTSNSTEETLHNHNNGMIKTQLVGFGGVGGEMNDTLPIMNPAQPLLGSLSTHNSGSSINTNTNSGNNAIGTGTGTGAAGGGMDGGFDIFSFLMDEESLGGTGSWDVLDVPADFSLWS